MTWQNLIWRAAPALFVILIISYYAEGFSAFPSALVAWGTILLAYATFTLVRHSKKQEDQRRQEEQAKEKRDRDERLLNEIIEWAEDIDIASLTPDISFIAGNTRDVQLLRAERDANTLMRYGISRSKATSILTIVEERFKGALLKYLNKVLNELIELMYIKQMMLSKALPNEKNFPKSTVNWPAPRN